MSLDVKGAGRRTFLRGAVGAAAILPAMQALDKLANTGRAYAAVGDYGPLIPTADLRDGVQRISLPAGFSYRTFSVSGGVMHDGKRVPLAHDGMGLFHSDNKDFRLVRNHEDRNAPGTGSTAFMAGGYDSLGGGGTTTLVVDPVTRTLKRHFISSSGTFTNCAGGVTPWGSWITCEETNAGVPQGFGKQHGYCFEVPARSGGAVTTTPIPQMGRFAHEAVAVDPNTGIVYETEDNGRTNSGFYRYRPLIPGVLQAGGALEQLAVANVFQANLYDAGVVGQKIPCTWVPIANPDPPGQGGADVFNQGRALGAAAFARLEGAWWGEQERSVFFTSTTGGAARVGQVWQLKPLTVTAAELTLIYESPGTGVLDLPDNITVSPNGALLLCEDGGGQQYLRGVTLAGQIFDFGLNLQNDYEWAGACFGVAPAGWLPSASLDQRTTLFVNRQGATGGPLPPAAGQEGMTFAIWGPWSTGVL